MRISDWSSDVCSSDLLAWRQHPHQLLVKGDLRGHGDVFRPRDRKFPFPTLLQQLVETVAGDMHFVDQQSDQPEVDLLFVDAADRHEAGLESEVIPRSEERRVGKEWDSTCRSRW